MKFRKTDWCSFFGGDLQPVLNPLSITSLLPPQLAGRGTSSPEPTPLETMLGLQSAVLMFMISMVTAGVTVYAKDPKVVHAYVAASAITDFPHWASFAYVLGWEGLRQWINGRLHSGRSSSFQFLHSCSRLDTWVDSWARTGLWTDPVRRKEVRERKSYDERAPTSQ